MDFTLREKEEKEEAEEERKNSNCLMFV